ncbi:MAG: MFS transporter [Pseudomonadota bacterium]|nr:MFS transporter [Pseudomonadota bacterium]
MSRAWFKSPYVVLFCAVGIVFFAYGSRQSLGIYLKPITADLGWGRESLSIVFGAQALIYGMAAPFVGAIADKWGPIKVMIVSAFMYSAGIFLMTEATTPAGMLMSASFLGGVGSAGCALSLILAVASRVAPEEKRGLWLGIITSGGTGGQLVLLPAGQLVMNEYGWVIAIIAMSLFVLMILPLVLMMGASAGERVNSKKDGQSLAQALNEALAHRGFWLLVLGFFTCGFQVQYINNHLPAYLTDMDLDPIIGATAISVIGLFNMIGTWCAGWLGDRYRKKYILALLYFFRSLLFMIFILAPLSPWSVYLFSASIGLLWLATVPLTSGIVFGMFGPRYMATLYGIVFLSHQVGSFASVWLGGFIWDRTGSYEIAWWIVIIGGALASLLHWPIDDRPVQEVLKDRAREAAR